MAEEQVIEKRAYTPAVGRRKAASARIRLFANGKGEVTVNEKPLATHLPVETMQTTALKPLNVVGQAKSFDVSVKILGGGLAGHADAISLGIARALVAYNPEFRPPLKAAGLLMRDAREKERKKPGLKKARKAAQWSKR